ncbi:hypothetical protein KZ294_27720, partial [Escherichia coli]|nr:hypothetical protein [Escherichia coli]
EAGSLTEPVAQSQREYEGQRADSAQFRGIVMVRERQSTSRFALAAWRRPTCWGLVLMPVSVHDWDQVEPVGGCQAHRLR